MNGIRLAFSWLTVFPVRGPETVERADAARAIAMAPVVGAVLGVGAAGLTRVFAAAGTGFALAGLLTVAALALVTRGMHVDGLADTMDGLGSYGPPERAREIMKSGGVGPFGVVALIVAIGVQALAFASLAADDRWWAIALAVAVGRVAVVPACRHGYAAAPGAGFGALVAGTQSLPTATVWTAVACVTAVFAVPDHWWLGPLAVAAALAATVFLVRHCVRRFDGLSGDVLGAVVETAVSVAAIGLSLTF
ncbi:adenosylcobinamide-GDP ribazoletransferase [Nocardia terpenica]|uniref:Adenosylcobinamide-GDP ribazoletransferase n=1 Tax=Nocardia terpenica TaxID=455432 RepID=A0A6G9Z0R3_9NOCA|nr:adenosylcobinamide-GDP ribazoletransferase [Nocardia terpenica]QIS19044.1 adenosylcobinamide-GDP ribazoletransferase [Nocardia terpenica]